MTAFSENTIKLESDYDIACLNELEQLLSSNSSCSISEIKTEPITTSVEMSSAVQYNSTYFYNNTSIKPANYNSSFNTSATAAYQYEHSAYQSAQETVQPTNNNQFCLQPSFESRIDSHEKSVASHQRFASTGQSSNSESYSSLDSSYSSPPVSPDSDEVVPSNLSYYQQSYSTNYYQNTSASSPK
jgi:hypothetical protein